MKEKSTNKYKYSKIQYFFWLLSGAEISILKECPTDYNRQAGIGFTIFMTTLLAFCSGSYAGWFFGESWTSAIVFGLIWALLIFSIDRSMVITMKKDPTKPKQNFWMAFLTRAVLAALIAFVISIPLELLIFKDNIEIHKPEFIQNKVLTIQGNQKAIEGITDIVERGQKIENELSDVQEEIKFTEPQDNPAFDQIKRDLNNKLAVKTSLDNTRINAITTRQNAWAAIPTYFDTRDSIYKKDTRSNQYIVWQQRSNTATRAIQEFNNFDQKGLNQLQKQKDEFIENWKNDLSIKQVQLNSDKAKNDNRERNADDNIVTARNQIDSLLIKNQNGFVFNFMVLEDAAKRYREVLVPIEASNTINNEISSTEDEQTNLEPQRFKKVTQYDQEGAAIFFLLWLIRILFFTIEILPTIAKIATPLGAYDRAIYRKEKDLELELEQRTEKHLENQKILREIEDIAEQEQLKERTKIENQLHKELLTEIAKAQDEVAKQKIEEFKRQHLKIKQNGIQVS